MSNEQEPMDKKPALYGRGGMTIDDKGTEGVLGWWPEKLQGGPNAGTWTNALFREFGETLRTGQRYHEQNRAVIEAKNAGKVADIPDPLVRQKLARQDQKKIAAMKARVDAIDAEIYGRRIALRPYDYDHADSVAALNRQELRAHLRGMDDKSRREALKKFAYRASALESEPELAGLSETQAKMLHDEIVAQRFPADIANVQAAEEGVAHVKRALHTTERAIENELRAAGTTVAEPTPKPQPKPWIP